MCHDSAVASKEAASVPAEEIEVTQEMIKSMVAELYSIDYRFETHEDVAERIFKAMFKKCREMEK